MKNILDSQGGFMAVKEKDSLFEVFGQICKKSTLKNWADTLFAENLGWRVSDEDNAVLSGIAQVSDEKSSKLSGIKYCLVFPTDEDIPCLLVYIDDEVKLENVPSLRRLFQIAYELVDIRQSLSRSTAITIFCNGQGLALMDTARTRDHRLVITPERIKTVSRCRDALEDLYSKKIQIRERLGVKIPDFSKFFEQIPFDKLFLEYIEDYHRCVIEELLIQPSLIHSVLQRALMVEDLKTMPKFAATTDWVDKIIRDYHLKETILAISDTYMLRQILHQFIEAYHGVRIQPSHQYLLEEYAQKIVVSSDVVGKKSNTVSKKGEMRKSKAKARFPDPYILKDEKKAEFHKKFLKLDKDYAEVYRGDVHYSQLAIAVEFLEQNLDPKTIADALDLLSQKRYSFRYADIRPEMIETYYENSLSTDLDIVYDKKNKVFSVIVVESDFDRKRGGTYFTPQLLSQFTVKHALTPLLDKYFKNIRDHLNAKNWNQSTLAFDSLFQLKCCDPTVGGGSFVKEAFRLIAARFDEIMKMALFLPKNQMTTLQEKYSWFSPKTKDPRGQFEHYILTHMLYGVDIDLKALCIASQTLALESLSYLQDEEVFPNFININFKRGNTFVSVLEPDEWKNISPGLIKNLLKIRRKARSSVSIGELHECFKKESELISSILSETIKKSVSQYGDGYLSLRPFEWHLEFPEVFYDENGKARENRGFDLIVGNPPWEAITPNDDEFFSKHDPNWPTGKNVGKKAKQKYAESLLKRDDSLREEYETYLASIEAFCSIINSKKYYNLQKPKYEKLKGTSGDNNTWKLASEFYPILVNSTGRLGVVIPAGFCGDKGARDIRVQYLQEKWIESCFEFNKKNDFFSGTQAFCTVIAGQDSNAVKFRYKTGLSTKEDLRATDTYILTIPETSIGTILDGDDEVKALVEIKGEIEEGIIKKIRKFSSPNGSNKPWAVTPYRELDTTNHNHLETKTNTGYLIAKGEDCGRFTFNPPERYLKYKDFKTELGRRFSIDEERVAWRNIAGTNDPRRMYATILPPKVAAYNSYNMIKPDQKVGEKRVLVAILNSYVYEWWIRKQSKNNNLNIYIIKEAPLPRPNESDRLSKEIIKRVDALYNGSAKDKDLYEAEIEALVAQVYGLNEKEFSYIVESYIRVDERLRSLAITAFRKFLDSKTPPPGRAA